MIFRGWQRLKDNPDVEVKLLKRKRVHYLLARSRPRRQKERAIRRRQRRGLARALGKLRRQVEDSRLKDRDKILERVGRLKGRFPKARPFVTITVAKAKPAGLSRTCLREKFRAALAGDGAYLLRSNQDGWTATEFWRPERGRLAGRRAPPFPPRRSGRRATLGGGTGPRGAVAWTTTSSSSAGE